jgi:hypothetical protein
MIKIPFTAFDRKAISMGNAVTTELLPANQPCKPAWTAFQLTPYFFYGILLLEKSSRE